jgi:hypothetical protein
MEPTRERFCADCHGSLDTRLVDTRLGNASDFGKVHPQFQAVLTTERGQAAAGARLAGEPAAAVGRAALPARDAPEPDQRRRADGAAAGAGRGYGKPLECASCHRQTADGVRFLPVDMEKDCEACHSLVYDKVGPTTFARCATATSSRCAPTCLHSTRARRTARAAAAGQYGSLYRVNFGGPGARSCRGR